ncbi:30S ribosomal protein S6 [Candidatus Riesia sp. GBBU]|nr:30S ribosomal protein S6 [Candidatus Riesia sp. GBBU]
MNYYECVLMIHPSYSEKSFDIIECSKDLILKNNGNIYRIEDWGRRQLSYPIKKLHKAHYILINFMSSSITIKKLEDKFRFDEKVIRSMILRVKSSFSEPSIIMMDKTKKDRK